MSPTFASHLTRIACGTTAMVASVVLGPAALLGLMIGPMYMFGPTTSLDFAWLGAWFLLHGLGGLLGLAGLFGVALWPTSDLRGRPRVRVLLSALLAAGLLAIAGMAAIVWIERSTQPQSVPPMVLLMVALAVAALAGWRHLVVLGRPPMAASPDRPSVTQPAS